MDLKIVTKPQTAFIINAVIHSQMQNEMNVKCRQNSFMSKKKNEMCQELSSKSDALLRMPIQHMFRVHTRAVFILARCTWQLVNKNTSVWSTYIV